MGNGLRRSFGAICRRKSAIVSAARRAGSETTGLTGTLLVHADYSSFGNLTYESTEGIIDRYLFQGRELDPEIAALYFRARYLFIDTGRFNSQDPKGFAAGDGNLYRFVFNNPSNLTDPSGLDRVDVQSGRVIYVVTDSTGADRSRFELGTLSGDSVTLNGSWGGGQISYSRLASMTQGSVIGSNEIPSHVWGVEAFVRYLRDGYLYPERPSANGPPPITIAPSAPSGGGGGAVGSQSSSGQSPALSASGPGLWNSFWSNSTTGAFLDGTDQLFAGWADALTVGGSTWLRSAIYGDTASRNHQGRLFTAGQWIGTGHSLLMGGSNVVRTALAQGGAKGGLLLDLRRLIWDNRRWETVRRMWSRYWGGLAKWGQSLHHAVLPQRLVRWGIPHGIINSGLNYMPMSAWLNSYMNGSTWARVGLEWTWRGGYLTQFSPVANSVRWSIWGRQ